MKILIITKTLLPTSGIGRYSRAVLEEYTQRGIPFKVLTEPDGIVPLTSFFAALKNISTIKKASLDCDIIHAFDGWPYAVYAHMATLFTSKRLIVNAVGTYAVANLRSLTKGMFLRRAYKRAEKIFAISKFVADNILKYIKLDNLEVVYLGTTLMKEPAREELENFKKKYQISLQTPILLTVGALKDRKGQFETLQSVELLKKQYSNILYCMVGSKRDGEAYVRNIEEYVSTHNLASNVRIMSDLSTDEELACMYVLADIFLLNSKHDVESEHSEGFGLVLLEAAQFGLPVVGSRGSGIPEAMEDGYNGYLVDTVKAQEIAITVEKVLANYNMLSEHSREVAQRFSWKKTADSYIRGYI